LPVNVDQGVAYFAVRETVVFATTPFMDVKLCRISFGADGSVYVSFPYSSAKRGLLSRAVDPPKTSSPVTYDLSQEGVVVPVDVKFSHHASGAVGFSRTGLKSRLPRQQSFPLESGEGVIFQLHVQWLGGFTWTNAKKSRTPRLGFEFRDEHPFGLRVEGQWLRKAVVARNTFGTTSEPPGPRVQAVRRATGVSKYFIFIGQPAPLPFNDHVLAMSVEPVPLPTGADSTGMIFVGGFGHDPETLRPSSLCFMYPYEGT
jgi:hypothetical protein